MTDTTEEPPQGLLTALETQGKLLLTTGEVAHLLSMSRTIVYQLMKRRQLFSVKIGGARRIPTDAVQAFVEELIAHGE
jgi:excisionase family DNA binding protein